MAQIYAYTSTQQNSLYITSCRQSSFGEHVLQQSKNMCHLLSDYEFSLQFKAEPIHAASRLTYQVTNIKVELRTAYLHDMIF